MRQVVVDTVNIRLQKRVTEAGEEISSLRLMSNNRSDDSSEPITATDRRGQELFLHPLDQM